MIGLTGRLIFLGALCVILFSIVLYFFNYVPDDTFITLRYAKNAIRGYGLVFNRFDRVEGYSNFLWLMLLVAAGKAQLPLILASRALSLILSLISILLTAVYAGKLTGPEQSDGRKALIIGLPALSLAASSTLATWSLSGTELPLFTSLLLLAAIALVDGREYLSLTLAALLGLVRPEGVAFFVLFLLFITNESDRKRKLFLVGIAIAVALYLPYIIWKKSYFGSIIPNTYYAKKGPAAITVGNGMKYLFRYMISYGYMLLVGAYLLKGRLKRSKPLTLALYVTITHWMLIVFLGGDWMPNFRLLLPTTPFVYIIVSTGLIERLAGTSEKHGYNDASDYRENEHEMKEIKPFTAVLVSVVLIVLSIAPGFVDYEHFKAERITVRAFAHVGRKLKEILPPNTTLACGSTGAIGYYTDLPIVDILGLTDRHIATKGKVVSTQPGHMKTDGRYILMRKPALLLFGNVLIHKGIWNESRMRIKVQEREVTSLPQFMNLYEYINLPIGHGFYLSCYKRRDFFLPVEPTR